MYLLAILEKILVQLSSELERIRVRSSEDWSHLLKTEVLIRVHTIVKRKKSVV